MQIITGFDNDFTTEKKQEPLCNEYVKVLEALRHNHEVAENAFARISKGHFREQVDHHVRRKRKDETAECFPHWHVETSVSIDPEDTDGASQVLAHLVEDFGNYLLGVVSEKSVLVDSLQTKIMRVGPSLYQFRLKQRWVRDGG